MRKTMLFLILSGLLLAAAGCGGGSSTISSTSSKSVTVNSSIKLVIEDYFNKYFESRQGLRYSKMDSNILADNTNTQLSEAFRETIVNDSNDAISNPQYRITYKSSSTKDEVITVTLLLDFDFQYKNAPHDLKSGVYNVGYTFTLKKSGDAYVITAIDSDLIEFRSFKEQVREKMAQNKTIEQAEAVTAVKNTLMNEMQRMSKNSLYLKGAPSSTSTLSTSTTDSSLSNSGIEKSVYVSCNRYDYSTTAAVKYALTYAQASKRLFYSANGDCTNFASQCLWAGYVGYSDDDTAPTYIINKKGMIPTEWYAGEGGGAINWENVERLWKYLTDATRITGPKGKAYSASTYRDISFRDINVGDLLQVSNGPDYESHGHSLIVTEKASTVSSYDDIYVSYHTTDKMNERLSFVISRFGGDYSCHMRRFVPQSGYMK